VGIEASAFRYTKGEPHLFKREDSDDAPTREFCATCGVQIAARSPKAPGGVIVKVGALDDPSVFGGPTMVFWTQEKQAFHVVPAGAVAFTTIPGR
jgi:hypothetical protein